MALRFQNHQSRRVRRSWRRCRREIEPGGSNVEGQREIRRYRVCTKGVGSAVKTDSSQYHKQIKSSHRLEDLYATAVS